MTYCANTSHLPACHAPNFAVRWGVAFRRTLRAALVLALFGAALLFLAAQPVEVVPVRTGEWSISLNGRWKFRYAAGPVNPDVSFAVPEFDDSAWPTLPVPAHWELHGFATPKYATTDEGAGFYRRHFTVPMAWSSQKIFLHFDGALYGIEAWVNGRRVGEWASGYNPVAFDITDAMRPGIDNIVAVRVSTRVKGWEFDVNDCWGLAGIFRDVTVFAVPPAHLQSYTTRTTLNPDGSARLDVSVLTSAPARSSGRLLAPDGRLIREFPLAGNESVSGAVAIAVDHPQLWTAETPYLYTLELTVGARRQHPQVVRERIGLREVSIRDGVLRLNGRPIKLRGVDHHDIWPDVGRAATEDHLRRDLELIKAANGNFIRTSHYPPHPRLIELCDELGIYVMDEVPFGFGDDHLTDPGYQEILFNRARATVRRDRNRPSVIIWSVGNENPNMPLTFATGRRVKEVDSSRPICFPQMGSYFAGHYRELPDWVDIYAPHYPDFATVCAYAEKLDRPVIFTEFAHSLGLAGDQVQAEWAVMQASPRLAGGALWMFQDQGILRASEKPVDPAKPTINVWPDPTHFYDTAGNLGMDGVVYSDRTPQPDYWQVRKVYSPVQIAERRAAVRPGSNQLTLHVENRFDFRPLTGLTLEWSLLKNGTPGLRGRVPLQAPAHEVENVPVAFALPAGLDADVWTLELRCADGSGESLHERTIRLDPDPPGVARAAQLAAQWPASRLSFVEVAGEDRVTHDRFELIVQRKTGEITLRDRSGHVLVAGIYPHIGRRFTEAETMRAKREQTWTGAFLHQATNLETSAARTADGVALRVRGRYVRPDAPEPVMEGEVRLLVRPTGVIEVEYAYGLGNGHGLLLEAGLSLVMPAEAADFRWIGAGPFAGYPGKDALNEFGLNHLNRVDIRFQGNRREVDVALLTTAAGAGVALAGTEMDVAVERIDGGTVFSHNAVLSGRGTKFASPDTMIKAEGTPLIAGHFTLLALAPEWPARLRAWFGEPGASEPALRPFYHSYDQ